MTSSIPEKIREVRHQISVFVKKYNRPEGSVALLCVSKTHPKESIIEALACQQRAFGENYLQEALGKISELEDYNLVWHFIGPIQSNKTRTIAENFDWVHSVDREKIAQRLSDQRPENLLPLKVLLQVNLDGEDTKAGIKLDEVSTLAKFVSALPKLELAGLMSIPAAGKDFEAQRQSFRLLAQARDEVIAMGINSCTELSIGMSNDKEAAIAEGATIVRIGTDIFGARNLAGNNIK